MTWIRVWIAVLVGRLLRRRRLVLLPPLEDVVIKRLHERLWHYAKRRRIPIFVLDERQLTDRGTLCAGQYRAGGKFGLGFRHIRVLDRYRDTTSPVTPCVS